MPSAGRPFTPEVLTRLVAKGVGVAPLAPAHRRGLARGQRAALPRVLPGVARRPPTASTTPAARAAGSSPSARPWCAPSSRWSTNGARAPERGWTETVVSPEHPVRSIDGFLTGWHEPEASHLAMLEAIAGRPLLERPTRRRSPRATCGTSSATSTWSCRDARDRRHRGHRASRRSSSCPPRGGPSSPCSSARARCDAAAVAAALGTHAGRRAPAAGPPRRGRALTHHDDAEEQAGRGGPATSTS